MPKNGVKVVLKKKGFATLLNVELSDELTLILHF